MSQGKTTVEDVEEHLKKLRNGISQQKKEKKKLQESLGRVVRKEKRPQIPPRGKVVRRPTGRSR